VIFNGWFVFRHWIANVFVHGVMHAFIDRTESDPFIHGSIKSGQSAIFNG
jgi:hypothetical protein